MRFFFLIITLFLSACSNNMNIEKFGKNEPKLKLEDYFNGKTEAWGLFHDRFGNLKRSFKVSSKH